MRPALLAAALVLAAPAGMEHRVADWLNAPPVVPAASAGVEVEQETPPRAVLAERVAFAPLQAPRTLPAQIRARTEADLGFRVGGRIERRLVDAGAAVRAGEVLAVLDPSDLRLQLAQAEAELRAATGALQAAEADERRASELTRLGSAAQAALERSRAAADESRGRVVRAARATELARNALGYATLAADADGVVTSVFAEPGQVVQPGTPVLRLARRGEPEASVALPEPLLARAGQPASVELFALPGRRYAAALRELSPAADPATRTFAARYILRDAGPEVRLGMSATLTLFDPGGPAVAALPLSAVRDVGGGPHVWVIADGRLQPRPVVLAGVTGNRALVREGLREGEQVVAMGVHQLETGARVRVVPAPPK